MPVNQPRTMVPNEAQTRVDYQHDSLKSKPGQMETWCFRHLMMDRLHHTFPSSGFRLNAKNKPQLLHPCWGVLPSPIGLDNGPIWLFSLFQAFACVCLPPACNSTTSQFHRTTNSNTDLCWPDLSRFRALPCIERARMKCCLHWADVVETVDSSICSSDLVNGELACYC